MDRRQALFKEKRKETNKKRGRFFREESKKKEEKIKQLLVQEGLVSAETKPPKKKHRPSFAEKKKTSDLDDEATSRKRKKVLGLFNQWANAQLNIEGDTSYERLISSLAPADSSLVSSFEDREEEEVIEEDAENADADALEDLLRGDDEIEQEDALNHLQKLEALNQEHQDHDQPEDDEEEDEEDDEDDEETQVQSEKELLKKLKKPEDLERVDWYRLLYQEIEVTQEHVDKAKAHVPKLTPLSDSPPADQAFHRVLCDDSRVLPVPFSLGAMLKPLLAKEAPLSLKNMRVVDALIERWGTRIRWETANAETKETIRSTRFETITTAKLPSALKRKLQAIREKIDYDVLASDDHMDSPLQRRLFQLFNSYTDVLAPLETPKNVFQIREAYLLHALNHIIKSTKVVKANNAVILEANRKNEYFDIRDQGFARGKVLIVVPTRSSAHALVHMLQCLVPYRMAMQVQNKIRFENFFGPEDPSHSLPQRKKPDDFNYYFLNNQDDCCYLPIRFNSNGIQLYSPMLTSDMIIASPLGLRILLESTKKNTSDHDFLTSIEVAIFDQSEMFLMQNWEHIDFILKKMNKLPFAAHGTDFSRVRQSFLDGLSPFQRQTIMISSHLTPEINNFFNAQCNNLRGKAKLTTEPPVGSLSKVMRQIPHRFYRFSTESFEASVDDRLKFFMDEVVTKIVSTAQQHVIIFIPSYFDYIRIRNSLKEKFIEFLTIHDYSTQSTFDSNMYYLSEGKAPILLYTERFHFFNRPILRGVENLIFYGLPVNHHYYPEITNMINSNEGSCTTLFSKYDLLALQSIVGPDRARKMIVNPRSSFMILSGK